MMRELVIALVLLVALSSGQETDEKKPILNKDSLPEEKAADVGVQHFDWKQFLSKSVGQPGGSGKGGDYDWKKWLSKSGGSSGEDKKGNKEEPTSRSGKTGKYDWKQWLSKSVNPLSVSGADDEFDWKKYVSNSYIPSGVQYYDWKQWFSKTGKPSEASKDGIKNWDKWMSYSYIDPPSGLSQEYSFKPYDWKNWLSGSNIPPGVQYYDWQQWLSKTGGGKSTGTGKDGKFDWKKFLSNSYDEVPSGLEEEYSFKPFDWKKFMSGSYIPSGVQFYDWQQWLSKSGGGKSTGTGKDDKFDWKKFLSNSYDEVPSGLEEEYSFKPFDWKKFLSGSYIPSGVQFYDWQQWLSKSGGGKSTGTGKDGNFDWKKFLSNSYDEVPSGLEEEYSFKPFDWKKFLSGSYIPSGVQFYDWQQWLSKTGGGKSTGTGKDGKFDWKKFLSNSYDEVPSGLEEEYSFKPFDWKKFMSGSYIPSGVQFYDWQQWLSKSGGGKSTGTGKDGKFDWKKFLSNSYDEVPSGLEEEYSFKPFDWKKFMSGSYIPSGVQFYDWQQWLSKSGGGKSTGTGKDGKFDWKKFLSNSYDEVPSGLEEEYSFKPFDWKKFMSGSYIPSGVQFYDWQQWLSKSGGGKSTGTGKDGKFDWKKFLSNSYDEVPSGLEEEYSFKPFDWKKFMSGSYIPSGVQFYDWQQWLSKSGGGKSTGTGKDGKFDWKKFLSNSYDEIPSGLEEEYSFKPFDWKKFLSGSYIPSGVQYYDWQQWLSKKGGKSTGSGENGKVDWKQYLSNSYDKPPSGLEEEYSFKPYDWKQWLSQSGSQGGDYDWKQWLSNSNKPSGV